MFAMHIAFIFGSFHLSFLYSSKQQEIIAVKCLSKEKFITMIFEPFDTLLLYFQNEFEVDIFNGVIRH